MKRLDWFDIEAAHQRLKASEREPAPQHGNPPLIQLLESQLLAQAKKSGRPFLLVPLEVGAVVAVNEAAKRLNVRRVFDAVSVLLLAGIEATKTRPAPLPAVMARPEAA